jgi:hypothetical protein
VHRSESDHVEGIQLLNEAAKTISMIGSDVDNHGTDVRRPTMSDLNGAGEYVLVRQWELQIQFFTHTYRVIGLQTNAFFGKLDDLARERLTAAADLPHTINPYAKEFSLLSHGCDGRR